jgi:hypothetical protein
MYLGALLVIMRYSAGLVILKERCIIPAAVNVDALPGLCIDISGMPGCVKGWQSKHPNPFAHIYPKM